MSLLLIKDAVRKTYKEMNQQREYFAGFLTDVRLKSQYTATLYTVFI